MDKKRQKHNLKVLCFILKENQGKYYSEIVLNGILQQIEILETFPETGTIEPLLKYKKFEYRFLVKWNYKIIYRIFQDTKTVYILRIFHTAQHPIKLW